MKLISYSLWGSSPKYCVGAIKNAQDAQVLFPDWICRFHVGRNVAAATVNALKTFPNVQVVEMSEPCDWTGLFWRFYPLDDEKVEVFMSRDTDSRLTKREKSAVDKWLESGKSFHIMKDHPWHTVSILGGMWGCFPTLLRGAVESIQSFKKSDSYGTDQDWLHQVVYPSIKDNAIIHDSIFNSGLSFPTERVGLDYVGQIYDENEVTPQEHTEALRSFIAGRIAGTLETPIVAPPIRNPKLTVAENCLAQADIYFKKGKLAEARVWLQRVLDLTPGEPEVLVALGNISLQLGDHPAAFAAFAKAAKQRPRDAALQALVASSALQAGRIDAFETALARALEVDPKSLPALHLLAKLNLEHGSLDNAEKTYGKILAQDMNNIEALLGLGVCSFKQGKHAAAREAYEKVLKREPENVLAKENLKALPALAASQNAVNNKLHSHSPKILKSSHSSSPRISIVVPSFNQGQYIEDTITSVLDQGYPETELIIFDAGSKDNTVEILKKYDRHINFWASEPDKGHTDAINKGLRRATGQILAYLNSDDFFLPNAFHYVAQAYAAHPDAGLFTGNGLSVNGRKENARQYLRQAGFTYESLLRGSCYLLQPSSFITRKAWEKLGEFDDSLKYAMDLDYWLRASKEFDVVFVDALLSAWRMHENIKTNFGGFVRWTELWRIYRKHTKDQITPGLLVELFTILQEPQISQELGMDIRAMAQKCFQSAYDEMQRTLNLRDCVPVGKGILFRPKAPSDPQPVFRAYPTSKKQDDTGAKTKESIKSPAAIRNALPVVKNSENRPRIDIVLQATGEHAWAVGGGWEIAARKLGFHHRTFRPRAAWGAPDVTEDDGLFEYLAAPEADIILLCGFDWHSQMLHGQPRWQDRWSRVRARKVLYVQESIRNHEKLSGTRVMEEAFRRAAALVDAIIYTDLNDRPLMEATGKPALFQPFGVDDETFIETAPFVERLPRAFFRGKHQPFAGQSSSYQDRRALIQFLLDNKAMDLVPYEAKPVTPRDLAADFNRYQVALNFPSVFSNHPTRIYEAMACGCAVITNRTGVDEIDRQFQHGRDLMYYSNREELLHAVTELTTRTELAAKIGAAGTRLIKEHHSLQRRLTQAVEWLDSMQQTEAAKKPNAASIFNQTFARANILIDGVIFDLQRGNPHGISRVWQRLLEQLAQSRLGSRIVLLDRGGASPAIPGIRRIPAPRYNFRAFEDDSLVLQKFCDQEKADLLISTYHTYAEKTPTVVMLHDLIPEITGADLSQPEWRAKDRAIRKSIGYLAVSESTVNDFRNYYVKQSEQKVFLTRNAVGDDFRKASALEVREFKEKHGIGKPYFLLVGHRANYKNAMLFFRAFELLPDRGNYEIVCVGGAKALEPVFRRYVEGAKCHILQLSDAELSAAYSGAVALVYPSRYEGFGLPVLEAQKCDCPVITCRNSSIPEVAGEAAYYVGDTNVAAMKQALLDVQRPDQRQKLAEAGRQNFTRFSWTKTGQALEQAIINLLVHASELPPQPNDPLETIGRMLFVLSNGDSLAKDLSGRIRLVLRHYGGFEPYNRDWLGTAEAEIAEGLRQQLPSLRGRLAPLNQIDSMTAFVLGLEAQSRQDWKPALQLFAHAYQNLPANPSPLYQFRLALRIARVATAGGDAATATTVAEQVVEPMRRAFVSTADVAAEEKAICAWDEIVRAARRAGETRSAQRGIAEPPLVSAIVSTYKAGRFMRGCLEDLQAQTIAHKLEIIIIDSNSPDNEGEIVKEFQQRYSNIVYIRTDARETMYAAWNRGVKTARGKYITSANTDDRHRADALEILAHNLEFHPEISLAYADCLVTQVENETMDTTQATRRFQWLEFSAADLLSKGCFCGPQPMWRREVHNEDGYFDGEFVAAGDYEFWLKLARTRKFLHVKEVLGLYLESPTSVEHTNGEIAAWEVCEAKRRHGPAIVPGFRIAKMPPRPSSASAKPAPSAPAKSIVLPRCALAGHLAEARELLEKKQYSSAWESTLTAIQARPFHPEAFLHLAKIALAAGDGTSAGRCARYAHQIAPEWKPAKKFLKSSLRAGAQPGWLVLPSAVAAASASSAPRLSVCLIVKNEEQFLEQCLQSVRELARQIVVVDTGSTDRTVEIAKKFNAEVHSVPWNDDFGAARNEALLHATGDWVLSLDADEELLPEHRATLLREMQAQEVMGYRIPIFDKGREKEGCNHVPRLFRNAPGLFFVGRVHEQVFSSVAVRCQEWGLQSALGKTALLHHGYQKELMASRDKVGRNLRLIRLALEDKPDDPNLLMNLGLELARSGQLEAGLEQYQEALRRMSELPREQIIPEVREALLNHLIVHLLAAKDFAGITRVFNSPAAQFGELTASHHFGLGLAQMELRNSAEAAGQMRQCLAKRGDASLTPVNPEILGGKPHHCLALCLMVLGEKESAGKAFAAALREEPASRPIRFDLARYHAETGQPLEALKELNALVAENPKEISPWELGGQIALSRHGFLEFARDWTGVAMQHFGESPVLLSQRAEVLLLTQEFDAALELWRRARGANRAREIAAVALCEFLSGESPRGITAAEEAAVSREMLKWYRQLLAVGAHSAVKQLHERMEELRGIVPGFARVWDAANKQAREKMAVH